MVKADQLAHERKKAQFDVGALTVVWAGSQHALQISDRMAKLVASDPMFLKDDRPRLSLKELFRKTLNKAAHAWTLIVDLRLSEKDQAVFNEEFEQMAFNFLCRSVLDRDLAEPSLTCLGTDVLTLIKKWVFFQLAPIYSLGLPMVLEEITFHSMPFPYGLIKKDFERIEGFFFTHGTRALISAQKFGVTRDEAARKKHFKDPWQKIVSLQSTIDRAWLLQIWKEARKRSYLCIPRG